ncbi:MAG: hypothetical protein IPJ03_17655 [Ignavibacteriales bacterium]|nr:hypothetical protein [Ignavibacteriales bacterium]
MKIYGNRFFEAADAGGGNPAPVVDTETQAKLARLEHLEAENKDLISQRDKLKEAKRKEAEDKLKADGELQKLLDAKEAELSGLKQKADAFEALRNSEIEDAKKSLGDKWNDDYSLLPLPTLRKTVQLLNTKPIVPGGDNGRADDPPKIALTEAQKKEAYEKFPNATKEKAEEAWFDVLKSLGKIK